MSSNYQRMMQENLDGALDGQREEELWQHLEQDEQDAAANAQLQQVHHLFLETSSLRAPQRLAATIMARLSQELEVQAGLEPLSAEIKMALMTSASMVTLSMMPAMLVASYMVMNRMRSPQMLGEVVEHVIILQLMMVRSMALLLEEVELMVEKHPDKAPVAMALIPVALQGMLQYIEDSVDETSLGITEAGLE